MTPTRLRECLAVLHWTQRGLADVLGLHETRVRRWARGVLPTPDNVAEWLERLVAAHAVHQLPEGWKIGAEEDKAA
jgi:transcriptional regulator with XRE-family HTH domain